MIAGAYSDGQSSKTEPATLHRQGEWVEIRDSNNKTLRRVALSLVNITFVQDPNGNILEMKTMVNPDVLFATQ
jgi:hypothetical protein